MTITRVWLVLGMLVLSAAQASPACAQVVEAAQSEPFAQFLLRLEESPRGAAEAMTSEPIPPGEAERSEETLTLADVMASLYRSYPEILAARQQPRIAGGELLSAYGAYDTKLEAESFSEPTGFYENYRHGLGLARQTWWGGYLAAGYRVGRGSFQPWYKERQTDEAGEFKLALGLPLLQGRAIDPQRVAVFQAALSQQAAGPMIQQAILDTSRDAAATYWQWVAAGNILEAQRELLALAEERRERFEMGVEAGRFAEIDLLLNQQLIAERRVKLLSSEQKFRATTFKLAMYLRDANAQPMVPRDAWLPTRFPVIQPPQASHFQDDLAAALARRPEPQILQLELRQIQLDRRLARNEMLPRLDLVAEASQDMGAPATKADDKGEFELVLGITSEVPLQRRKARGKMQSTSGKIVQINEKMRLVQDKIGTELQTAYNAMQQSAQVVEQTELALQAALETLSRYRFAFEKGKIDLIYLNLLEAKVTEIEINMVEAQRAWFAALAEMQIALGLDPLDQALVVASLPPSDRPGPGRLPEIQLPEPEVLNRDWELHSAEPPAAPAAP